MWIGIQRTLGREQFRKEWANKFLDRDDFVRVLGMKFLNRIVVIVEFEGIIAQPVLVPSRDSVMCESIFGV